MCILAVRIKMTFIIIMYLQTCHKYLKKSRFPVARKPNQETSCIQNLLQFQGPFCNTIAKTLYFAKKETKTKLGAGQSELHHSVMSQRK